MYSRILGAGAVQFMLNRRTMCPRTLAAESEREASAGHILKVPTEVCHVHGASREGERDGCSQLDILAMLGGYGQWEEWIVVRLGTNWWYRIRDAPRVSPIPLFQRGSAPPVGFQLSCISSNLGYATFSVNMITDRRDSM